MPSGNPGIPKSPEHRAALSRARMGRFKGRDNPNWKGGRYVRRDGYVLVTVSDHPHATIDGQVLEHRLVMEGAVGRYLEPGEVVHHINGDPSDNRIENLELLPSQSEHVRYHGWGAVAK